MIISWVTPINDDGSNVVNYWPAGSNESTKLSAEASTTSYRYFDYTSGFLHHATIKGLEVRMYMFFTLFAQVIDLFKYGSYINLFFFFVLPCAVRY